ncbi:MAG: response regulator [Candidatus Methanofastidiosia archaeon]
MKKVLIVDDDDDIRIIYSKMLSKKYHVLETDRGREALKRYIEERPEIIIMDTKMPDMSGIEVTREILKINPDAIIIGATGYMNMEQGFIDAGAKKVLQKPFSLKMLIKTIDEMV